MYYYNNGYIKQKIYGIRNAKPKYYNPMVRHLIDYNNIIQVKIKFLGSLMWINIKKYQLEG